MSGEGSCIPMNILIAIDLLCKVVRGGNDDSQGYKRGLLAMKDVEKKTGRGCCSCALEMNVSGLERRMDVDGPEIIL